MGLLQRLAQQAIGERSTSSATLIEPWVLPTWARTAPDDGLEFEAEESIQIPTVRQEPALRAEPALVEPSRHHVRASAPAVQPTGPVSRATGDVLEPEATAVPSRTGMPNLLPAPKLEVERIAMPATEPAQPMSSWVQGPTREVIHEHHVDHVETHHLLERIVEREPTRAELPTRQLLRASEPAPAPNVAPRLQPVIQPLPAAPVAIRPAPERRAERHSPGTMGGTSQAIHIAIGRVVVTAPALPSPAATPRRTPALASVNLGEYLASTDRKRGTER